MGALDDRPFGTTRSYWLQRRKALSAHFNQLMMETGNPEVMTAMSESHLLLKQIDLEAVRQDPLTLQYLLGRYKTACARMTQAAMEDVPGGKLLLKDMGICEKVLKIPDTSIIVMEDPYLRPEHDVDLSVLPPSSNQGFESRDAASAEAFASVAEAGDGHRAQASSAPADEKPARKRGRHSMPGDDYQSAEQKENAAASKPSGPSQGQDQHQTAQTKVRKKRRWLPWFVA